MSLNGNQRKRNFRIILKILRIEEEGRNLFPYFSGKRTGSMAVERKKLKKEHTFSGTKVQKQQKTLDPEKSRFCPQFGVWIQNDFLLLFQFSSTQRYRSKYFAD